MLRASDPQLAVELGKLRQVAAALLAQKAGCRADQVVVREVRTITFSHRLEDPTGQHAIVIDFAIGAGVLAAHGPECGYRNTEAAGTVESAQADGLG